MSLEHNDAYKSYRLNLTKNRLRLRYSKKKNNLVLKNIDRVESLSYGFNSFIILREILKSVDNEQSNSPDLKSKNELIRNILVILEGLERYAEHAQNLFLNTLDDNWQDIFIIKNIPLINYVLADMKNNDFRGMP